MEKKDIGAIGPFTYKLKSMLSNCKVNETVIGELDRILNGPEVYCLYFLLIYNWIQGMQVKCNTNEPEVNVRMSAISSNAISYIDYC